MTEKRKERKEIEKKETERRRNWRKRRNWRRRKKWRKRTKRRRRKTRICLLLDSRASKLLTVFKIFMLYVMY